MSVVELRFRGAFLEMFFLHRSHGPSAHPRRCKTPLIKQTLPESTSLPFVISTEAQHSGEIRGLAVFSWKCFSCRAHYIMPPIKGSVKLALPVSTRPAKRASASDPVALTV
jgi:hypothetical protein